MLNAEEEARELEVDGFDDTEFIIIISLLVEYIFIHFNVVHSGLQLCGLTLGLCLIPIDRLSGGWATERHPEDAHITIKSQKAIR